MLISARGTNGRYLAYFINYILRDSFSCMCHVRFLLPSCYIVSNLLCPTFYVFCFKTFKTGLLRCNLQNTNLYFCMYSLMSFDKCMLHQYK